MPIKQTTSDSLIEKHLNQEIEKMQRKLIRRLIWVGEQVRNEAITAGSYTDRTRHLRGSVGFVISIDGRLYMAGEFGKSDSPAAAKAEGLAYAKSLINKAPNGITLIVVAGKNYAKYVSEKRDVLDSSEILAERLVPQMLRDLGFKI